MSRKLFAAAVILSVVGLIVAAVRAQEGPIRSISDEGSSIGRAQDDDSDGQERSVLARPRPRRPVGTGLATQGRDGGSGLAERLQRLRSSATAGSNRSAASVNTASRRATGGNVQLNPITPLKRQASEPRLKKLVGSANAEPTDEPSILEKPAARSIGDQIGSARRARREMPPRTSSTQQSGVIYGALLESGGPALHVSTVGPPAIIQGKSAEFTITLENQSAVEAQQVFVRVGIPDWVELDTADATAGATEIRDQQVGVQQLVWNATHVAAGSQERLTLMVTPRESRPFDLTLDWTLRVASAVARIEVQQPQLEMALFGPRDILYGASAVYTLQLTNPGTGPAEEVAVEFAYGTQRLPTKQIGSLAAGEKTEISVELTAREAGQLRVAAVATAAGGLRVDAAEEVRVRRAQIQVEVMGPPTKFAGGVGSYHVQVRNSGDAKATDVVASILLPSGAEYVAGDLTVTDNSGLVKQIGELAPGAERIFKVQTQLTTPGDNRIEARAQASGNLAASGAFVTHVTALADLKLVVNDPSGPAPIGKDANYEVTIVNRGTKAASQVTVVVQFSEGIEPIEVTGVAADIVPGQILFRPISRIAAGEKMTLKIKARADREGNHRFRAEVRCTQPETVLVAEESTYFFGEPATTARSSNTKAR